MPRRFLSLFAALLCAVAGCSNSIVGSTNPLIFGYITHNGAPVKSALVTFSPELSQSGPTWAECSLGSDGFYRISTNDRGFPLEVGWYRIGIRPNRVLGAAAFVQAVESSDNSRGEENRSKSRSKPTRDEVETPEQPALETTDIPPAYLDPDKSKLRVWVRAQPMQVDINLLD